MFRVWYKTNCPIWKSWKQIIRNPSSWKNSSRKESRRSTDKYWKKSREGKKRESRGWIKENQDMIQYPRYKWLNRTNSKRIEAKLMLCSHNPNILANSSNWTRIWHCLVSTSLQCNSYKNRIQITIKVVNRRKVMIRFSRD